MKFFLIFVLCYKELAYMADALYDLMIGKSLGSSVKFKMEKGSVKETKASKMFCCNKVKNVEYLK